MAPFFADTSMAFFLHRYTDMQELRLTGALCLGAEALSIGLAAGLCIGFLRLICGWTPHLLAELLHAPLPAPLTFLCAGLFIGLCACTAFWCMKKEPLVAGSGIPQVECALAGVLPLPWLRVLLCKFLGTLASLCGCLSLGRAAPSVQMGAAIGCGVGALWHNEDLRPRFLAGGSAAGLAAAFGAPWAGIVFAFEELRVPDHAALVLFMTLASGSAWLVTDCLLDLGLIFPLPLSCTTLPSLAELVAHFETDFLHEEALLLIPLCGLVTGLVCGLHNRCLCALVLWTDRHMGARTRLACAFATGLALLFLFPALIDGLGPTLQDLVHGPESTDLLLLLFAGKLLFNWISAASNAPGGLLMPLLTAGGLCGVCMGALLELAHWTVPGSLPVIFCMAGFFAGIVRAPVTAALLVVECTGTWAGLPALLATSFLARLVAGKTGALPVFTFFRLRLTGRLH